MAIALMSAVLHDTRVAGSAKLILLGLADCANDDGVCWPSIARLQTIASLSEKRNVYTHLANLEESGYLKRVQRPGRSSVYTLNIEMINGSRGGDPAVTGAGDRRVTGGDAGVTITGDAGVTGGVTLASPRSVIDPSREPSHTDTEGGGGSARETIPPLPPLPSRHGVITNIADPEDHKDDRRRAFWDRWRAAAQAAGHPVHLGMSPKEFITVTELVEAYADGDLDRALGAWWSSSKTGGRSVGMFRAQVAEVLAHLSSGATQPFREPAPAPPRIVFNAAELLARKKEIWER